MPYKPSISDEAVKAKTGYGWSEWFARLDRRGAADRSHKEIATYLSRAAGLSAWWSQMVTEEYEKARGLRARVGQKSDSPKFQVSVQRTVNGSAEVAYRAFATSTGLRAWLGREASVQAREGGSAVFPELGEGSLRIVEKDRRLRMGFEGRGAKGSTVEITATPKGENRCAVRVQHTDLGSEAAYKRFRAGWTRALEALRKHIDG
jgi:uncharacterized protein YndB with AHSA1/START domain